MVEILWVQFLVIDREHCSYKSHIDKTFFSFFSFHVLLVMKINMLLYTIRPQLNILHLSCFVSTSEIEIAIFTDEISLKRN